MPTSETNPDTSAIMKLLQVLGLPWIQVISRAYDIGHKLFKRFGNEGMYEVLDYETKLELKDSQGEAAIVQKREKIRFLQNNIIAFQDQAWGDGEILVNYRCSPGIPVDRYRLGFKNHILISLREVKNRGDEDEFRIEWDMRNGFLVATGFWATEISHPTNHIKVQVLFPKERPPLSVTMVEKNRQRQTVLEKKWFQHLPDDKWLVNWETNKPQLFEQYILKWEW